MEAPATYPTLEFSSRYSDWRFYGGIGSNDAGYKYNHPDTNTPTLGVCLAYLTTCVVEAANDIYEQFVNDRIFTSLMKGGKVDYRLIQYGSDYLIVAFIEGNSHSIYDSEILRYIAFKKLSRIGYIESE